MCKQYLSKKNDLRVSYFKLLLSIMFKGATLD